MKKTSTPVETLLLQRQEQISSGLRQTLSTPEGRAFILDLLSDTAIFDNPFPVDAVSLAFINGGQRIGQKLFQTIMAGSSAEYITAMKEYNDHARELGSYATGDLDDATAAGDWGASDLDDAS